MRILFKSWVSLFFLLVVSFTCKAQDSTKLDHALTFPDKFFGLLNKKAASMELRLDRQTQKYLSKLQKQEYKLRKKMMRKDSSLARQLFDGVEHKYNEVSVKANSVSAASNVYSGRLDSLNTALNFLNQQNNLSGANSQVQKLLTQYSQLQASLNQADRVKAFISQRKQLLKEQFQKLGMVKQFKSYEKQVYYYRQQMAEYKEELNNPEKIGEKLLSIAQGLPAFKDFFAKNSILGSLFALPGSNGSMPTASIAGLQTRSMINQSIVSRFGNGTNINQALQQNIQSGQSKLNALKNQVSSFSSGSYSNGSDKEMPDFKPNSQKTKSFLKRLEVGTNLQSQKAQSYFPVTTDIGLSLGYKLNDKSIIGVGASYKLGLGTGWNNIRLSHQGVGLRSYLDYMLKGSFFFSGGYEQNYKNVITTIDQLRNYSAWQSSGLIGMSKRYQVGKKLKGEMKLLWDFLSYQQVPRTQAIVFRIGYSLK
jgi:hypothetical protein